MRDVAGLDPQVIVGCHTPVIDGPSIGDALALLGALPDTEPPPHPDRAVLDTALAGQAAGA